MDIFDITNTDYNKLRLSADYMSFSDDGKESCWQSGSVYLDSNKIVSGGQLYGSITFDSYYSRDTLGIHKKHAMDLFR